MLEIQDVRVVYPNGFEALKSVSLTVRDGEIVALVGRSGAGKSTLLRCVNGLQRVAIVRALAQQPRVLLADELVASLDVELSWQVMSDLVHVGRDEGVPTLISIHQVDLAKTFTDRLVGIAQGTAVFDGPPDALDEAALDRIYRFDLPLDLRSHRPIGAIPAAAV